LGADVIFRNVSFTHLGASTPALKNINLEIEEGSFTAIVGQVGAGKSTLLLTLNGLAPTVVPGKLEGQIIVAGQDVRGKDPAQMARYICLVFDDPSLQIVSLTVEEDVAFGPANLGLPREKIWERVHEALKRTRLEHFAKRNPRTLSGGEQQLLALAGVLAMRPRIVALDEPVAMLDPLGKAQMLSAIRELNEKYGTTIIITDSGTDIEAVCELADHMVLMKAGEIVAQGSPGEIFAQRDLVEEAGLKAPQVTRIAWQLNHQGSGPVPVTLEEGRKYIVRWLGQKAIEKPKPQAISEPRVAKSQESAIVVNNLHHVFPVEPPVHALQGIDLTIHKGEMVALLGQNGSGKTTLSYHLVGVEKPTNEDARIVVDDLDVLKAPLSEIIKRINYLFQNPANQLFCETFGAEVSFGPRQLGFPPDEVERRTRQALDKVGLSHLKDSYTFGILKSTETLLSLASVLAMDPHILIADEPTGGLDYSASEKVMEILKELNEQGRTIIFITHSMELAAKYAKRIVIMQNGKIRMDGTPRQIFSQAKELETMWLYPPQVTRLAQSLQEYGFPPDILTEDEFVTFLASRTLK